MANAVPIRIMLLEDDEATRLILAELFAADRDFALVASFASVSAGFAWLETHAPDVLLADLHLKDGLSVEVIRKCALRYPHCSILVLTTSGESGHIDACIEAGAQGYLLKEDGLIQVPKAIKDLQRGSPPMSGRILRHVLQTAKSALQGLNKRKPENTDNFTPREIEVLVLLEKGLTYEACALHLGISKLTLENYIKRIYRKLKVNTRSQAVYEAKKHGLL